MESTNSPPDPGSLICQLTRNERIVHENAQAQNTVERAINDVQSFANTVWLDFGQSASIKSLKVESN